MARRERLAGPAMTAPERGALLTLAAAEALVGQSADAIEDAIACGELAAIQLGSLLRLRPADLEQWSRGCQRQCVACPREHPGDLRLFVGPRRGARRRRRSRSRLAAAERVAVARVSVAQAFNDDAHTFSGVWALHAVAENA